MLTPSLAPKALEKKFRAAAGNFNSRILGNIPVLVAPSREATYPLIIARHTDTQIEKWQTAMKAHFYSNLIESGLSIDEIAERFNVSATNVREGLHDHNLYRMACAIELPSAEAEVVHDPRRFSLTTLKRVFETPAGRDFFGVELGEDGKIRGFTSSEEFRPGFTKLVSDVANGTQDSRTLNSPSEIKAYLDSFGTARPDKKKKGGFDSDSFAAAKTTRTPETPPLPPPRKQKRERPQVGLIPPGFPCGSPNERVKALDRELKGLSPSIFPNACAFTLRSLIEIGAFCYLDRRGEITRMQNEFISEVNKKNASRPIDRRVRIESDWTPSLSAMMNRIGDASLNLLSDKHTVKALNKVVKEEDELFGLNLSIHNSTYHPNETRLRAAWRNLEGFFEEILA